MAVNINEPLVDVSIDSKTRYQFRGSADFKISTNIVCQNNAKYQICAVITAGRNSGIDLHKDAILCSRIYFECSENGMLLYLFICLYKCTHHTHTLLANLLFCFELLGSSFQKEKCSITSLVMLYFTKTNEI